MGLVFPKNESKIKLKVFIVDDSPLVCDNLKDFIEENGHEAIYEIDPEKALQIFIENDKDKNTKFDVLIVDQRMPVMDGVMFITEIKTINPRVYIIMLTVEGKNTVLEDTVLELGITAFIDKEDPDRFDNIMFTIAPIFEEKKISL